MIDTKWMFIFLIVLVAGMFISSTIIAVSDNMSKATCHGTQGTGVNTK